MDIKALWKKTAPCVICSTNLKPYRSFDIHAKIGGDPMPPEGWYCPQCGVQYMHLPKQRCRTCAGTGQVGMPNIAGIYGSCPDCVDGMAKTG